jgi:hypothetical protein
MTQGFEDQLVRTLHAAAQAAPAPEPNFPDGVARVRRRRGRIRVAGAGALTVLIALSVAVGLRPAPPPVLPADPSVVDLSAAKPYHEVWPHAIVSLPATLPDGRNYTVEAALGHDTFVGVPSHDKGFDPPVLINPRTQAVRELGTSSKSGSFGGLNITDHFIVWVVALENGNGKYREVWSAPRDGDGTAVRRAVFPDGLIQVAEVSGVFYAYADRFDRDDKSIYRLPDGGPPVKLAGSKGWMLAYGPWAAPIPRTSPSSPIPEPSATKLFWNVATGERRTSAPPAGVEPIDCRPQACLGVGKDGLVAFDMAGGDQTRTTGVPVNPADRFDAFFDSTGRFVQVRWPTGPVFLWDRRTGTAGLQVEHMGAMGYDLIELDAEHGHKNVLDLTRIP